MTHRLPFYFPAIYVPAATVVIGPLMNPSVKTSAIVLQVSKTSNVVPKHRPKSLARAKALRYK